MCVCVRAHAHVTAKQKFVLTEFWFFALEWAMRYSLEKRHLKNALFLPELMLNLIAHASGVV